MIKHFDFFLLVLAIGCFSSYAQITIQDGVTTGIQLSKSNNTSMELLPKIIHTLDLGISLPQKTKYYFNDGEGQELRNRLSFDIYYSVNYPLFKKVTIGIITGIQHQSQASLTAAKLGGILRYYFKDYASPNFYFMTAKSFGLSKEITNSSGYGNARLGLQFPIQKFHDYEDFNLTFNIFWDNDSYSLQKPLLADEKPRDITFHGAYGLGLGIQF